MGLIADGEVEGVGVAAEAALGLLDDGDGLVGGEDDGEGVGVAFAVVADALGEAVGVGGGGQGEGVGVVGGGVVVALGALVGLGVGADADGVDGDLRVVAPRHEGLVEERDGGDEEEDEALAAGLLLDEPQGGEGLTRAAGHDELAAVVGGVVRGGGGECLALVVAQGLGCHDGPLGVAREGGPVGVEIPQTREGHHLHGDVARGECLLGVGAEGVGGGEEKAMGEGARSAREGDEGAEPRQKGVDVGFGDDVPILVALGLDAVERALVILRHQIDARVMAEIELRPEPDAAETPLIERQTREQRLDQTFEPRPQRGFVPLRLLAETRQHIVQRHVHRSVLSRAPSAGRHKKTHFQSTYLPKA